MRPPEFTGGNGYKAQLIAAAIALASMRPPEFTGGNQAAADAARTVADTLQ